MPYHYLEEFGTADIAFEATGRDLPELFMAAADATMNVMIDNLDGIEPRETLHIELSLWVDSETYAPLRYTDHSWGLDASGKPFDQTYFETVQEFKKLPDTRENRELLELGPH